MGEKLTLTGRLTRVETKFAFIATVHGSVFCPLSAAVPSSEHVPSFSLRYNVGDIVHVTMVPQEGKNGCKWRAAKVRPVNKVEADSNAVSVSPSGDGASGSKCTVIADKCVVVTNVCETLAYGVSDEFGSVFIPGAAFSADEVTRLNSYLSKGDEVIVSIRPQNDVNGCKWIAVAATKLKKSQEALITGCGKIVSLTESCAVVWYPSYGEIRCSILTWIGGDGGNGAEWLTDILNIGDTVLFTAAKRKGDSTWKAVKWTARGFRVGEDRVYLADSYTQTAISTSEITRRYIVPLFDEKFPKESALRVVLN